MLYLIININYILKKLRNKLKIWFFLEKKIRLNHIIYKFTLNRIKRINFDFYNLKTYFIYQSIY